MADYSRDIDIGSPKLVDGKHILLALENIANDNADIISEVMGKEDN